MILRVIHIHYGKTRKYRRVDNTIGGENSHNPNHSIKKIKRHMKNIHYPEISIDNILIYTHIHTQF